MKKRQNVAEFLHKKIDNFSITPDYTDYDIKEQFGLY